VIEMVALLPVYMGFIIAVVFVGKLNNSSANIEAAARSAARTISLSRDPQDAIGDARAMAADIAEEGSAFCTTMDWADPEFEADPAGQRVTVTITCTVDLSEATFIGLPGDRELTATATEVIDKYRETP
jgi:Flp pilus assembly protein TadG